MSNHALSTLAGAMEQARGGLRTLDGQGRLVRVPYPELAGEVRACQARLAAAGLRAGMRVALWGPNSREWLVADLALIGIGCVSVCLPEDMPRAEPPAALAARYGLSALVRVDGGTQGNPPWTITPGGQAPAVPRDDEDMFSLTFSSGTLGRLKCMRMSARGIANTMQVAASAWGVTGSDNVLVALPFSSIQQRTLCYMAIAQGCDCTVVAPQHLYRALALAQPTILVGPPAIYEQFEQDLAKAEAGAARAGGLQAWLRGFRLMLVGSAPSRHSTLAFFAARGLPLYEVYGMNEFGWIAFNLPGASRAGTVGRLAPGVRADIAGDGELLVHGAAAQALGYLGEADGAEVHLPGGWVRTGDLAALEAGGWLRLTGRKKNVIIRRTGEKLQPETVEARIESILPQAKAMVFEDAEHLGLACVVWVPRDTTPEQHVYLRRRIGEISRSLGPSLRIGSVLLDWDDRLRDGCGLTTRNGKLNRGAVIDRYAVPCKGAMNACP